MRQKVRRIVKTFFFPVSYVPPDHFFCSRSDTFKESQSFVINKETFLSSISILKVLASSALSITRKEMDSVESAYSGTGHSEEHSRDPDCPLLVGRKDAEIFDAFLNEFAGGDWAFPNIGELQTALPYADEDFHGCERGHSSFFASDDSTSSVMTGVDSPPQIPTADSKVPRKSLKASLEECGDSCPDSNGEKNGAAAPITADVSIFDVILAHSSVRALSNTTYLRRMHLSREDAIALFPEIRKTIEYAFKAGLKRHASPGRFKIGIDISLQDEQGRRWPVALEVLHTAGQRHVRFNKGWAQMSIANGFAVGKCIRLARWDQASPSKEALVTVSAVS